MNNLDTQTVKGIVGENFISSKQQKISCIKTETYRRSGRNQSNDYGSKDPARYYTVANVGRCKRI